MAAGSIWRHLRLPQEGVPTLFTKVVFGESGYSILLTDLSNIWQETLDESQLLDRADNGECSINPRDDRGQILILLDKIKETMNGAAETTLCIQADGSNSDDIMLLATASLPAPLPPLVWRMILAKQPQDSLARQIISPLLLSLHAKQSSIDRLQSMLREKDHVISRCLDRLESSGTDLTTIFPGISNMKLSKSVSRRSQVARYVKGLGPFDAEKWEPPLPPIPSKYSLFDTLDDVVDSKRQQFAEALVPGPQYWWTSLSTQASRNGASGAVTSFETASYGTDNEETDDDEFQIQKLPAHLKYSEKPGHEQCEGSPRDAVGEEGRSRHDRHKSDQTEPDRPSSPTLDSRHYNYPMVSRPKGSRIDTASGQPRRLGAIGGRPRHAKSEPEPKPKQEPSTFGYQHSGPDATQTPSDDDRGRIRAPARLGLIGGRIGGRPDAFTITSNRVSSTASEKASQAKSSSSGEDMSVKSGELQPVVERTTSSAGSAQLPVARNKKPVPDSPPRETSQERANRRREELKRQLDSQPKTPTKKRRRF